MAAIGALTLLPPAGGVGGNNVVRPVEADDGQSEGWPTNALRGGVRMSRSLSKSSSPAHNSSTDQCALAGDAGAGVEVTSNWALDMDTEGALVEACCGIVGTSPNKRGGGNCGKSIQGSADSDLQAAT